MLLIKNFTKTYGISGGKRFEFRSRSWRYVLVSLATMVPVKLLIKAMVGILPFDQGEIYIDGHSIKDEPMM